jgi:glycosyltransferase involved in cell wall biosynthesis
MSIRLLFLNTRDQCGADVAVHLMLMAHFDPQDVDVFFLSNSEALDAVEMRDRLASMPHVTAKFLPLGRPAEALAAKDKLGKALAYGSSAVSLARAAAFIRQHRIQVIHSTDRPRDASFSSLLGRLTGTVSVVHMHSNTGDHHSYPTVWGMHNATALFAISDSVRRGLGEMGLKPEKIHTVHNAVDVEHFDPDKDLGLHPPVRRQFNIPENAPLVGIAARLIKWKGQRELIGAASQLQGTFPDLHVMILGADVPDYRADLERMAREGGIADRVHFGGYQKDVRPFLREFDIFVHPSYCEPFGLAIAEAMAMRRPVIACNTGGVPEIITHGKDGWLVEPESPEQVAEALTALLQDPGLRRRMGEAARETVHARFLPRHQCTRAVQHYAKLLNSV